MQIKYSIIGLTFFLIACSGETQSTTSTENNEQTTATEEQITEEIAVEEMPSAEFVYDLNGYKNLDFTAYVNDPDTKGPTNIRTKPNGSVLVALEKNDEYMLHIIECSDGWFKIDGVEAVDSEIDFPAQFGWIHNSVLEVSTRNYGNQSLSVYENPTSSSKVVGSFNKEKSLRFTKIYKDYALVTFKDASGKKIEGWIELEWLCGNPVTTCS